MSGGPPDWASVRAVLALEVCEPLLPAIGVVRGGAMLREIVRRHYAPRAGEPLDAAALAADFAQVVADVDARAGPEAAGRFRTWAQSRFTGLHADQPALSGWIEAFRAWAFARGLPDALRPPAASHAMVMEVASAYRAARAQAREAAAKAMDTRLSDVDLAIMAGERWLGGDHPVVEIGFMAGGQAFTEAWVRSVEPLPESQKALLHALAERTLAWREIEDPAIPRLAIREVPTCL